MKWNDYEIKLAYEFKYGNGVRDKTRIRRYLDTGDTEDLLLGFVWAFSPQKIGYWSGIYAKRRKLSDEDRDFLEWVLDETVDQGEPDEQGR